jgi:hypothetical protein
MANLNISHAAAEVVALINSRPASPRVDEIEAIIAKVIDPTASVDLLAECNAKLRTLMEDARGSDEEVERAEAIFREYGEREWAKPVSSLPDLYVRIALAVHWNSPMSLNDWAYPYWRLNEGPERLIDERALAFLVQGLLELTGLCFDQNGLLIGTTTPVPFAHIET